VGGKRRRAEYHLRKGGGRGKGRDSSTERCSVQQQWLVCIIVFIAIFIMFVLF